MALKKMCSCGTVIDATLKSCEKCLIKKKARNRQNYKIYDRLKRDKRAAAFYSSKAWQLLRQQALIRDKGLCQLCLKRNKIVLADAVDHIIPIEDSWEFRDKLDNLQSLCDPCHKKKTAADKDIAVPKWLKPSAIPLFIVCGPSGAGKTRYVREHANTDDIIIDLDEIKSKISGLPWYQAGEEYVRPALQMRNQMLYNLSNMNSGRAWFIVSSPKGEERKRWAETLKPVKVIVIETPLLTCIERLKRDPRRATQWHKYAEISRKWWKIYTRNIGEERITNF